MCLLVAIILTSLIYLLGCCGLHAEEILSGEETYEDRANLSVPDRNSSWNKSTSNLIKHNIDSPLSTVWEMCKRILVQNKLLRASASILYE
jgi:hypothetical protein